MRMMAISSRREKVASLMVFVMMKRDTTMSVTTRTTETMLTMFRSVTNFSA